MPVGPLHFPCRFQTRCPTRSVQDKTLEEAWSGRKSTVKHLKIFGCLAYEHVQDKLRKKLDDKVIQMDDGIFVSQKKYASDILKRFRMECSKPVPTPMIETIKLSKNETGLWRNQKSHIGLQQSEFSNMSKIVIGPDMLRLERVHQDMLFI
ncbi:hypothetical protein ZIOFF_043637 [Zingiber officinale]|uniref:Reverse transcriptase n=1 Tax=Zingiber officinale TaxID=94328 RepID=A0A8J5G0R5_ZINOF|nr:hypothetical protein ZIOFF_043637 [Zingiber officinale]